MLPTGQTSPTLEGFSLVASLLFSSGACLLGLAILRAAVLPNRAKVTGVALVVAAVCNALHFVPLPDSMRLFITLGTIAGVFSFLIGLAMFGFILVSLAGAQVVQPSQFPTEAGSSMPAAALYRLSGLALLVGSVLATLLGFFSVSVNITLSMVASPYWVPVLLIALTATILLLLGLPGMFVRLVSPASWSGIVGFALTFCTVLMLGVIDSGFFAFGIPLIATFAPHVFNSIFVLYNGLPPTVNAFFLVANLAFCVGAILFGRAILRAAVLPHNFDIIGKGLICAGPIDAIAGIINFVQTLSDSIWQLSQAASTISFIAFFLAIGVCGRALMLRTEKEAPIVGRPLLYGMLSASVVTGYVLAVGSISVLVQQTRITFIVSLFLIGLFAILFQPLRDRLQRAVNRLVYGERDNPYAVLSRLGKHMEATLAPESVLPTIVETIARSLKLPYAAIVLKQDDDFTIAAAFGSPMQEQQRFPLVYQAEQLGELVLSPRSPGEPLTPADQRLLHDLAPQIGVAVNAVRLTVDLQRSRERLVTTREEERRRLRRDLHDGLGPQLATLTLKLETARNRLANNSLSDDVLADLTLRTQAAVADIRRLVYALRPPTLDELGLLVALHEQAIQYSDQLHIHLDLPQCLPPLSAAVEVALYRVAQEALTNVVRHAHASHCDLRLALDEQANLLRLDIQDDGCGLPAQRKVGVGLVSMRERAEELGGTWLIEPASTGGTHVLMLLPYRWSETTGAALLETPARQEEG
jgi:signal transduction histidine kinase